jgi:hypothetical protein
LEEAWIGESGIKASINRMGTARDAQKKKGSSTEPSGASVDEANNN